MKAVISSLSISTYLAVSEHTAVPDLLELAASAVYIPVKLGKCARDHMYRCEKSESLIQSDNVPGASPQYT